MRAATRQAVDDAAAESVFVLRQIARGDDTKLRVQAAKSLIYQRIELTRMELQAAAQLPPPPPSDAQLIAEFVRGHSREQLIQLAANLLNGPVPRCLSLQPDEPAGGS
jgi:hypothetical protein